MAAFVFRKRSLFRLAHAPGIALLLFLLGGCAVTPKSASTQFNSFSSATDKLSEDTLKFYQLAYDLHESYLKEKFIQDTNKDLSAIKYKLTYLNPSDLAFRTLLLNTLKAYALSLKYIMSNEIDAGFEEEVPKLIAQLDSARTTLLPQVTLPAKIDKNTVAEAATTIADYFLARAKKEAVKKSLADATPKIISFVDILQKELGTCGDTQDTSEYCTKIDLAKETAPFVNQQICNSFLQLIRLNVPKKEKAEKSERQNDKQNDVQASHKIMITYRIKRDKACTALAKMQKALTTYAAAVKTLPETLDDPKLDSFAKNVSLLLSQLPEIETLLSQAAL